MEAAVVNTLSSGDRVLLFVNGAFGERFAAVCKAYGVEARRVDVPWGRAVEPELVRDELAKEKGKDGAKAVLITHNETSTGVLNPLKEISEVVRESGKLLIVDSVSGAGAVDLMTDEWGVFLQSSLQLPAFYEHGLWRALCGAARPALSDTLTHAIVLEAAMKQRQAQDLVVYAMDLEPEIGECSTEAAKERFLVEAAWQPVRALVERVHGVHDWAERVVAVNLCIQPLVGNRLRREMLLVPASANGDPVTSVIIGNAQREWQERDAP